MADVKALALSAKAKRNNGQATSDVVAISKAIRSVGITAKADYNRLMREVGKEFARNKRDEQHQAERRRA